MAPKRILIATPLYPPQVGGPATRAVILEQELPSKHGISVRTAKFGWVLWLPRGIRHLVYFLILYFMSFGTELILSLDAASVGWPASLVARFRKLTLVIIWVGDAAWERGVQQFGIKDTLEQFALRKPEELPERLVMFKRKQNEILLSARNIVVPSNYLKTIAVTLGIPAEKISVIYNAFENPVVLGVQTKEELRKYASYSGPVIISAGRLVPWKGFDVLIDLMPELLQTLPNLKLEIAGDGPLMQDLKNKVYSLGLEGNVFLRGSMERTGSDTNFLLPRIKAADLFVLNTGYEGLSHQLIEVMSIGTPIITTSVGGNPELIENGKEGILVDYNDKEALKKSILELLQNPERGVELAKNAKEKVSQFTVERMVSELVKLF